MRYECQANEGSLVFVLHDRVTYSDHAAFKAISDQIASSAAEKLVFDLAHVDFIDSAGLGMFLILRDAAGSKRIVLRNSKGQVMRVIGASHFETLFAIES